MNLKQMQLEIDKRRRRNLMDKENIRRRLHRERLNTEKFDYLTSLDRVTLTALQKSIVRRYFNEQKD